MLEASAKRCPEKPSSMPWIEALSSCRAWRKLASKATNQRWRVVLTANGLRVIRFPDPARRFVDAAADTCHRVQLEHEDNPDEYVLTSPGPPQVLAGDRYSVARVGPDRFWIVTWRLGGWLSVLSLEP